MSDPIDQFSEAMGGHVIASGLSPDEALDLYTRRRLAIAQGLDPDDPEVLARYRRVE